MFSSILNIIPRMSKAELDKMEKALSSRFSKAAKKFGKGVAGAFKGGGIAGAALGLLDKILNPLQEVQEALDRTLAKSGDLVDNAKQFGTSAGNLFKLQQLAEAKGLDEAQLYTLIGKFQSGVAEAESKPNDPHVLKNYVGTKDMAEGFFQFIQSLQKIDKNQQILIQEQVFGEKQVLKMAAFLNEDMSGLIKAVGAKSGAYYTGAIEKTDNVGDQFDVNKAKRNLQDMVDKSRVINMGMASQFDQAEKQRLQRENQNISNYNNLIAISTTVSKIMTLVEELIQNLGTFINFIKPAVNNLIGMMEKIVKSKFIQGIFGRKGD